jgi:ATP-dependent Clp protease protease subunit
LRTVVEESSKNLVIMDVFSKLIQERIIFIDDVITDELASGVIAQMLYLNFLDNKREISVYINSPGGIVSQGLAIYDIGKFIEAPIRTVCIGEAASMGGLLMLMGTIRIGFKHSRIMLHQVSMGAGGKLSSIEVAVEEGKKLQGFIYDIIKEKTLISNPEEDLKEDKWIGAEEALALGILTEIK